ncbi:hypothetical protein DYB34_000765 [Aphanomyces astaci]|uniref:Cytochrome b5 heme-binding domain-containing protein n=1 Tax=Aphanomyces astaci TaxID=112090 RepID=A0A397EQC7_APHAT|nr:hypothetical protein DYB34_000765 [Aphanomyces astaci]RHY88800.1 hypothetical protein DYB31_000518 [Aphanomyces astaci]
MSVAVATVAVVSIYVHWTTNRSTSKRHQRQRRIALADLNAQPNWVSLCGVVFHVDDENLLGRDGVYGPIGGHDATVAFSGRLCHDGINGETTASVVELSLDTDIEDAITDNERTVLQSWLALFASKFRIVGQLSDLYCHRTWDQLRSRVLHTPSDSANVPPSCPLGFGTRLRTVSPPALETMDGCSRWIDFSGTRYNVSGTASFGPDSPFATYVGHDITYALAIGSLDPNDLDVALTDDNQLTFAQQKVLAQYHHTFRTNLPVVVSSSP